MKGVTGENLLQLLERRLDNVVYRLGFASDHAEARQLVRHGHFRVNGQQVNIPSYLVPRRRRGRGARSASQEGDAHHRGARARSSGAACRSWLELDKDGFKGTREGDARARGRHAADPRAAHRRALLEVSRIRLTVQAAIPRRRSESATQYGDTSAQCEPRPRTPFMAQELARPHPAAQARGRAGDAHPDLRQVHVRAARARLRHDARQRAAPRAAVVAAGRGDHARSRSRARCTSSPPSPTWSRTSPTSSSTSRRSCSRGRRRSRDVRCASTRTARARSRPATSSLTDGVEILNPDHRICTCRKGGKLRMELHDRHRPRLRAGRAQQDAEHGGRHDPDRRAVLADHARSTSRSPTPASGSRPTTTS